MLNSSRAAELKLSYMLPILYSRSNPLMPEVKVIIITFRYLVTDVVVALVAWPCWLFTLSFVIPSTARTG